MLSPDLLKQIVDLLMPVLHTPEQRERWITAPFLGLLALDWQSNLDGCTKQFVTMLSEPSSRPHEEQPLFILLRTLQAEVAPPDQAKLLKLLADLAIEAQQVRAKQSKPDENARLVEGDEIEVGNIHHSTVAIGTGARATVEQVINYIQQLSPTEEANQADERDEQLLAEGVRDYGQRLVEIMDKSSTREPYRGLVAYTVADAEYFHGRDEAIKQVLRRLQNNRLTILQSESGSGKSSLLAAGIVTYLLATQAFVVILRPYDMEPGLKIKQTLLPGLEQTASLKATPLPNFLSGVTKILGNQTRLYLILDQFEEFFTVLRDESAQKQFIDDLQTCYDEQALNVHWLLSMRSEYFGHLASFQPQIRTPFASTYRLNRLTRKEAREVIEKPLKPLGLQIESALVDALLADLPQPGSSEINPAQLQLVCSALYDAYRAADDSTNTIPLALYNQQGNASGILSNYVKRALGQNFGAPEELQIARKVLVELVSSEQQRIRLTYAELRARLQQLTNDAQAVAKALETLVNQHLVVADREEQTAQTYYELTHDYLITEIQIDPEIQAQKAAQELLAQEVEDYQRHRTLLSPEKYAIINSQRPYLTIDPVGQDLLERSETTILQEERAQEAVRQRELDAANQLAAEQGKLIREQKKRSQQFLLAAATTLILAVIASALGWFSNRNALEARNQSATATIALATSQSALQNELTAKNAAQAAAATAESARSNAQQVQKIAETEAAQAKIARATAVAAEDVAQAQATQAEIARSSAVQLRQVAEQNARRSQADTLAYAARNQVQAYLYANPTAINTVRKAITTTLDTDGYVTDLAGQALFTTLAALPAHRPLAEFVGRLTGILPGAHDQQLLTLDSNHTLTLWQWDSVQATYRLLWPIGAVSVAAWSGDGQQFAFVRNNTLWTGQGIQSTHQFTLPITTAISHLAWQPGGNALVLVSGTTITEVDSSTGQLLKTWPVAGAKVTTLAWSPNGKLLALGDSNGGVIVQNLEANSANHLRGAGQAIQALAWSSDSQQVAAASDDHFVYLWAANNGTLLRTLPEHTNGASYVAWGVDNQQLITADGEGEVAVWQLATLAKRVVRPATAGRLTALQLNSQRDQLFALTSTSGVELWQLDPPVAQRTLATHLGEISQIEPHPATDQALVLDVRNRAAGIQATQVISLSLPPLAGCNPGTCITQASWSRDGKQLALGTVQGGIVISATHPITENQGERVCNVVANCAVTALAWNPNGVQLASGSNDGVVRLWSTNGKLLADGPQHQANQFGERDVTVLTWQPGAGQLLSGGKDGVLYLWSGIAKAQPIRWAQLDSPVTAAVWNPAGDRLLVGSDKGTLYLFTADGKAQSHWSAHGGQSVLALAWLANDIFASVGTDRTGKLWRISSLDAPIFVVALGDKPLSAARFTRNGQRIITGDRAGVIQEWWVQPQKWLNELDQRAKP